MELNLTPGQQALVRQAIESGRLRDEQQAVQEALALWMDASQRAWPTMLPSGGLNQFRKHARQ